MKLFMNGKTRDYYATATGDIYSVSKKTGNGKLLQPQYTDDGYMYVCAKYVDGSKCAMAVHRAVALAYIPNSLNKPTVNHIDSNPLNNHVDNLEWATMKEQVIHSYTKGKRSTSQIM